MTTAAAEAGILNASDVLKQWQGHRRLTRRVIDAFPEDKLFSFSVGGMRPFSELAWEFIRMAVPIAEGVATGKWQEFDMSKASVTTKSDLLRVWDEQTKRLDEVFAQIPPHRFTEVDKAFGQWEGRGIDTIQYAIDNEIHHRGQGYVYLRALGVEPPAFWER
ncbi:MAG: damage-inducible protein DinB [Acidobacteria bacterium]|nr:damage-inducible protein DinB [Acidobacteriota bacterium]